MSIPKRKFNKSDYEGGDETPVSPTLRFEALDDNKVRVVAGWSPGADLGTFCVTLGLLYGSEFASEIETALRIAADRAGEPSRAESIIQALRESSEPDDTPVVRPSQAVVHNYRIHNGGN